MHDDRSLSGETELWKTRSVSAELPYASIEDHVEANFTCHSLEVFHVALLDSNKSLSR